MTLTTHTDRSFLYRLIRIGFIATLLLALCQIALRATTVTGTFKYNGTPFTGSMVFQLTYPSTTGSYINLPVSSAPIPVINGTFANLVLDGNDTLLPRGTSYSFTLYDPYGTPVTRLNYAITGTVFDLGAAVPTPILTNNVSFLDLLGIRNFSALNATFTNQIQIGSGAILSSLGISNAKLVNGIAFAQAYATQTPASTTCGIQEALTALPSTGGIVILQPGSCNMSSSVLVSKSATFVGFGSGGYLDSSSFSTFSSGTLLNQSVTSIPAFSVSPSAATTLSGVHFRSFAVTGINSSSLFTLGNSSSTTAYLRDVELDDMLVYKSGTNGLEVVGNLSGLYIHNSTFNNNPYSGILLDPGSSYSLDTVTIGPRISCSYNTGSGFTINSPTVSTVSIRDAHFVHNTAYGLTVAAPSTTASVRISHSDLSYNGSGGLNLAGGFGHDVQDSNLVSGGTQPYGVFLSTTSGAGMQTLSLANNTFTGNTAGDVYVSASVPYILVYPQITQSTSSYTTSGWSISAGTATLTVANNTTISPSTAITVAGAIGYSGCTNFNGPHTTTAATSTTISFATTCSGTGTIAYVAAGSMVIAGPGVSAVHYILPTGAGVDQFASLSGCSFANDGGGLTCATGVITWPQPFVDTAYTSSCVLNFSLPIASGTSTQPSLILNWSIIDNTQMSVTEGVSQGSSGGFLVSPSYGATVYCHAHHI